MRPTYHGGSAQDDERHGCCCCYFSLLLSLRFTDKHGQSWWLMLSCCHSVIDKSTNPNNDDMIGASSLFISVVVALAINSDSHASSL